MARRDRIGIALGLANHRSDRFVVEFDIRLCGGLDQGAFRLGGLQSPDIRIFEETLGNTASSIP